MHCLYCGYPLVKKYFSTKVYQFEKYVLYSHPNFGVFSGCSSRKILRKFLALVSTKFELKFLYKLDRYFFIK